MLEIVDWTHSTVSEKPSCSNFLVTGNMQQHDAEAQRERFSVDEMHRGGARAVLLDCQKRRAGAGW